MGPQLEALLVLTTGALSVSVHLARAVATAPVAFTRLHWTLHCRHDRMECLHSTHQLQRKKKKGHHQRRSSRSAMQTCECDRCGGNCDGTVYRYRKCPRCENKKCDEREGTEPVGCVRKGRQAAKRRKVPAPAWYRRQGGCVWTHR